MLALIIGVNLANAAVPLPEDPAAAEGPFIPEATFEPPARRARRDRGADGPRAHRRGRADRGGRRLLRRPARRLVGISSDEDVKVLQKGDVLVVVGGLATLDPPEGLATLYRDAWFADGGYSGGDPVDRELARHLGRGGRYTGVFQGTQVDGRIIAASTAGAGLIVNVFAPVGALAGMDDDVEAILAFHPAGRRLR